MVLFRASQTAIIIQTVFHVPSILSIKAHEKLHLEAPYRTLTNAGHISYVELDGDTCRNLGAFESVIRCMKEAGIGYGSINHPPADRDQCCGYNGIIDNVNVLNVTVPKKKVLSLNVSAELQDTWLVLQTVGTMQESVQKKRPCKTWTINNKNNKKVQISVQIS